MTTEFHSHTGRVYTHETVKPVVMTLIRRKVPVLVRKDGWEQRVSEVLASDSEWLRLRNGCTPSALARDLEDLVWDAPDLAFYLK